MKKISKKILCVVLMTTLIFAMTGCTYITDEVPVDTETTTLETDYETGQTKVVDEIEIPGEGFSLVCTYDTGNYPLDEWRVTTNKGINMTVTTKGLPEGYKAYIEHMHADIILKSTDPQIDGITQDSMDDSDHRNPTNGFYVNDTVSYNNMFSIEGYTEQFYTLWGYSCGEYGRVSSTYNRLTESNLRKVGTYAEKLIVVYDIVICTPECEEGYVRSVRSELLIPLTSEITMIEKDFMTDEVVNSTEESIESIE